MSSEITRRIEWWERHQFAIPDPVCDTCNKPLDEFPAAIVGALAGSETAGYAACAKCRAEVWCAEPGDSEYFESAEFNLGLEAKKPRVNCGGRR